MKRSDFLIALGLAVGGGASYLATKWWPQDSGIPEDGLSPFAGDIMSVQPGPDGLTVSFDSRSIHYDYQNNSLTAQYNTGPPHPAWGNVFLPQTKSAVVLPKNGRWHILGNSEGVETEPNGMERLDIMPIIPSQEDAAVAAARTKHRGALYLPPLAKERFAAYGDAYLREAAGYMGGEPAERPKGLRDMINAIHCYEMAGAAPGELEARRRQASGIFREILEENLGPGMRKAEKGEYGDPSFRRSESCLFYLSEGETWLPFGDYVKQIGEFCRLYEQMRIETAKSEH